MRFLGRRELAAADPYADVARGEQIKSDTSRHGVVDEGNVAWPERIAEARRSWPEARPKDFEKLGPRRYLDRATNVEYVAARGAVLLNVGKEQNRGVNCFLVESGKLVFLRRPEFEEPLLGPVGHVHSQRVAAASPGPDGIRIL